MLGISRSYLFLISFFASGAVFVDVASAANLPAPSAAKQRNTDIKRAQSLCQQRIDQATRAYYKKIRSSERTLESLSMSSKARESAMRTAKKDYEKEVRRIQKECEEQEKRLLVKTAVPKNSAPVPSGKKVSPTKNQPPSRTVSVPEPSNAAPLISGFQIHGDASLETGYRYSEPADLRKNRFQLRLQQKFSVKEAVSFHFSQRAFFDSVVYNDNEKLKDTSPSATPNNLESEVRLREAFADISMGPADLRLGKQSVVWGDALSLFVADVVNGKDLREYIVPDFDWIRIPQWSADLTVINSFGTQEILWTLPAFNTMATPGTDFAFPPPVPAGIPYTQNDAVKPSKTVGNSSVGTRLGKLFGPLDVGAFYLHSWDGTPVGFRTIDASGVHLTPDYRRQDFTGLTFSMGAGDVIFKGEALYRPQAYLSTLNTSDADGVIRKDLIDYVVGMDTPVLKRVDTSIQVFQHVVKGFKPEENLVNEKRNRTHLSFWAKTTFFDGRLEPEISAIVGVSEKDNFIRPKVTYHFSDNVLLKIGADIFDGTPNSGLFGFFNEQDRLGSELHVYF